MIDRENIYQEPSQIVDVAGWEIHQDFEVFPIGARDKSLHVCPDPAPFSFCLPGHRYLFKEAIRSAKDPDEPRYPDQYWSEIIAFRIGRMMGLTLPPVFVAIDSSRNEPGTINEWFMGYPGSGDERYSAGGDFMQRHIPGYDRGKGRKHNLETIIKLSRALALRHELSQDWRLYWGLCLCFDALIGNTDRHQENWGLIWTEDTLGAHFSPYFDNGTSLGHELEPTKMRRMMRDNHELEGYLRRGRHQMRRRIDEQRRMPLIDGVRQYCELFPAVRPILMERLQGLCEDDLRRTLHQLTHFDIPHPLTKQRADFVAFLTLTRRERLLQALENPHAPLY